MKKEYVFPIPFPIPIPLGELLGDAVNANPMPEVRQVMFNPPATIVYWSDGTKTVARCNEQDTFSEEVGLAMACAKKLLHPYESFQECLDKAIRPKNKKGGSEKPARAKKRGEAKPEPVRAARPGGVGLDELLRMFANGAPSSTIEATIVLN